MTKKEDESLIRKSVQSSMSAMKRFILGSEVGKAVEEIKKEVEETIEETKEKLNKLIDHLSMRIISISFVAVGALIAFFGLGIFIAEFLKMSLSASFMLVGLIVIFIGWLGLKKNL